MLAAAKVLMSVFNLFQKVPFSFKEGKRRLFEHKDRLRELIAYSSGKISLSLLARLLNTSVISLKNLSLKQPCRHSVFSLCKRLYPNQLAQKEVFCIKKYLEDPNFLHWPVSSVYYQMMREKGGFCSLSAFYKYARKLGIRRSKQPRKKDRNKKGLRADFPLQILHADFTMLRMQDHTKVYFHFIADNFSRKILAWAISLKPDAITAAKNLQHVLDYYKPEHAPMLVITDDGSENKAETAALFQKFPEVIRHLVAQRDIVFSNSMIESINKSMKYYHLFPRDFSCLEQAFREAPEQIEEYDNRPTKPLHGYTPNEAFELGRYGHGVFTEHIRQARVFRIEENKKAACGVC